MAYTLHYPPSDSRALLPSISSLFFSFPLSFSPSPPQNPPPKKNDPLVSSPFLKNSENGIFLSKENSNFVLFEPSAIAIFFSVSGSPKNFGSDIQEWLEWDEKVFCPFVISTIKDLKPLKKEINAILENPISQNGYLVGSSLSLADIAIWSTLYPLYGPGGPLKDKISPILGEWFRKLSSSPPFSQGVEKILSGSSPETIFDSFKTFWSSENPTNEDVSGSPKIPIPGRRNILVTSALPYVNNVPHLGNIIGCVLSADVFARFCRRRGHNIIYICGTDEYGTATETKAMEEGITPQEICDKYHEIHRQIYDWFEISFDKFGRTSTPQQTEISQNIFKSLLDKGRLLEDTMEQPYCDTCQRFLADRFVEGTCPTPGCGYEDARGDQCDKCGKLLNPVDLINPQCNICRNPPRIRQTEHLFLDLPALKDELEKYVTSQSVLGGWSSNSIQTTNAWIRDGLKPRCITRDLKWGVPVPLEKYKEKVFYVWFDAPIGYISITANYTPQWREWWNRPEDVELVQFMGKDNVPFHTVIFPCTLLGTEEPWTIMKTISVTEYLNYEGGKFSKSRGVGVFGNDAKSTGIPTEVWRYYLLTNRPEVSDTVFTWADLQAKQNNELLKNLGNFVNRALAFLAKPIGEGYGSIVPDSPEEIDELTSTLGQKVGENVREYVETMEKVKLKSGLKIAMGISSLGNLYLQDSQFWKLFKENKSRCDLVLRTSTGLVHLLAVLLEPFMPSFSQKVLCQLNLPLSSLKLSDEDVEKKFRPWEILPRQHKIGKPEPIFSEMKDEEVEFFRNKFAGSQAERAAAEAAQKKKKAATPGQEKNEKTKEKEKKKEEKKEGKKGSEKKAKGSGETLDCVF